MKTITLAATIENLGKIQMFIEKVLEEEICDTKKMLQLQMAVEEIYVNISNYAYESNTGLVSVMCEKKDHPLRVRIEFRDEGIPFNPLKEQNVDITLGVDERKIGGLGIFLTQKMVDHISYQHQNEQNILLIEKIMK